MARGDNVRTLGNKLDKTHTTLMQAHAVVMERLHVLHGIIAPDLLAQLFDAARDIDKANDVVQKIYIDLDGVADELDSDEASDASTLREIEKDLALAQQRNEELESENDDLSAEED